MAFRLVLAVSVLVALVLAPARAGAILPRGAKKVAKQKRLEPGKVKRGPAGAGKHASGDLLRAPQKRSRLPKAGKVMRRVAAAVPAGMKRIARVARARKGPVLFFAGAVVSFGLPFLFPVLGIPAGTPLFSETFLGDLMPVSIPGGATLATSVTGLGLLLAGFFHWDKSAKQPSQAAATEPER